VGTARLSEGKKPDHFEKPTLAVNNGPLAMSSAHDAVEIVGVLAVHALIPQLSTTKSEGLGKAPKGVFEGTIGQRGVNVLEHLDSNDEQDRVAAQTGGVGQGFGYSGLAQPGFPDTDDVAVFLYEAAVEQFLDDARFELRTEREVEAIDSSTVPS